MLATKRSMSEGSTPSAKKVKRETDIVTNLKEVARTCLAEVKATQAWIQNSPEPVFNTSVLKSWTTALIVALKDPDLCKTWTGLSLARLDYRLKGSNEDIETATVNEGFAKFAKAIRPFINSLPAPSDFGRDSVWPEAQAGSPILCLRPTEAAGLPLCTLHDVFREFTSDMLTASEASDTKLVTSAKTAAAKLCSTMGDSFLSGSERSLVFDEAIGGLISGWVPDYHLAPEVEKHSGVVNRVLKEESVILVLREDKEGFGDSRSDVYMQIARDYDLYRKTLEESGDCSARNFLAHGAPTFLMCTIGPLLFMAGAFYDGLKPTVEPLGHPVFMLPDATCLRQQDVAALLVALSKGISKLKRLLKEPPTQFPHSTPRVYTTCKLFDGQTLANLTEFSLVVDGNLRLFTALMRSNSHDESNHIIFKMVQGGYGKDLHNHLAAKGLAPALYGAMQLEGAPTAYVMEYLQPQNWTTLHDFLKKSSDITDAQKNALRLAVDELLEVIAEARFVHGDLRPNNMMVHVDSANLSIQNNQARIKVIDFDWAGEAGRVFYPGIRNPHITQGKWPGVPGGPIEAGHDQALVASWLFQI